MAASHRTPSRGLDRAELTLLAVDKWIDTDRITGFEVSDCRAHRFNSPGSVAAKNVRKEELPTSSASKLEIQTIDCGRNQFNGDICRSFQLRLLAVLMA